MVAQKWAIGGGEVVNCEDRIIKDNCADQIRCLQADEVEFVYYIIVFKYLFVYNNAFISKEKLTRVYGRGGVRSLF